jgi:leucyl/phenylalanyl-tRNA---protein transferase
VALVERMRIGGGTLLDVQWATDHLVSLGVVEIGRLDYLDRLERAVSAPTIAWGDPGRRGEG